ncbi:transcription factor TFIID (or TATA-binding protein, TBP) domain-containing protein [Ditylenchus destructor]|nr:transcription factor TFIID (or TATA-binding protein, TBP) domain-containing protein [Ditylenchus destructor]
MSLSFDSQDFCINDLTPLQSQECDWEENSEECEYFSNLNVPVDTQYDPEPVFEESTPIDWFSICYPTFALQQLPAYTVQNITAIFSLGTTLALSQHSHLGKYNPERFDALIIKNKFPKSTALVFKSGKVVVVGTKNEEDARAAGQFVVDKLAVCGFTASINDFSIQNIVASGSIGEPISLPKLANFYLSEAHHEPELFPGLTFRTKLGIVNLFGTGKFVVTGAKTLQDLKFTWEYVYTKLFYYQQFALCYSITMNAVKYICQVLSLEPKDLVEHFSWQYPYNPLVYSTNVYLKLFDGQQIPVTVERHLPDTNDPVIFVVHRIENNQTFWHEDLFCTFDELFVYDVD